MKVVKCNCGNRVPILEKKDPMSILKCRKCGAEVVTMFASALKRNCSRNNLREKLDVKGSKIEGYW
ncbi:MAG: hypothetical protein KC589_08855 [Nanoarchaeota archaeon]|nr:hypothetical protein [Nanoarchaeota archaeon]